MYKDKILLFEDKNARKGWGYLYEIYTQEELWNKIYHFMNEKQGRYINHIIKHEYSDMENVVMTNCAIGGDGSPTEYRIWAVVYWEDKDG